MIQLLLKFPDIFPKRNITNSNCFVGTSLLFIYNSKANPAIKDLKWIKSYEYTNAWGVIIVGTKSACFISMIDKNELQTQISSNKTFKERMTYKLQA